MEPWKVTVSGPAARAIEGLPAKYSHAIVNLFERLVENPHRIGKPLRFELSGTWVARRGPYRVIFEIDEEAHEVIVLRVAHRADIYRRQ